MERIKRFCDQIRVFDGIAERTGATVELRALKAIPHGCTSMRDLIRKYRRLGDGVFYLPVGQWPKRETAVELNNLKAFGTPKS